MYKIIGGDFLKKLYEEPKLDIIKFILSDVLKPSWETPTEGEIPTGPEAGEDFE